MSDFVAIEAVADRIESVRHRTPQQRLRTVSATTGAEVPSTLEFFQRTGASKGTVSIAVDRPVRRPRL